MLVVDSSPKQLGATEKQLAGDVPRKGEREKRGEAQLSFRAFRLLRLFRVCDKLDNAQRSRAREAI